MHFGIIETESLENKKILKDFDIFKSYKENHPEDEIKIWTINKISINDGNAFSSIKKFSQAMNEGWYSLIWNSEFVHVIFKNKTFRIKNINPFDFREFNEVVKYGTSFEIKKEYFDNLRNSIDDF